MKKVIVFLFIGLLAVGCHERQRPESRASEALSGTHELRKMFEFAGVSSESHGSFFLFAGGYSSESQTEVSVKFAWKMNDGTYGISSLPLEKFRVNFDEKATTPTIKFRWRAFGYNYVPETQELMDENVKYAVLTIRESDWPTDVKLPLN